jgi:hypothetical protein
MNLVFVAAALMSSVCALAGWSIEKAGGDTNNPNSITTTIFEKPNSILGIDIFADKFETILISHIETKLR